MNDLFVTEAQLAKLLVCFELRIVSSLSSLIMTLSSLLSSTKFFVRPAAFVIAACCFKADILCVWKAMALV